MTQDMQVTLAGRRGPVQTCAQAVAEVAAGGFAIVQICGGLGLGKTRMLSEIARLATESGLRPRWAAALAAERSVPFSLYADLFPGLLNRPETPCALTRFQLHRTARAEIHDGDVLLLDDLHLADSASLQLTEYLLRKPPAGRLLIAAAFRPGAAPGTIVDAIGRSAVAYRCALAALSSEEAQNLFLGTPDARLALILRAGQGNPRLLQAAASLSDTALSALTGPMTADAALLAAQPVLAGLATEITTLDTAAQLTAHAIALAGAAPLDLVAHIAGQPLTEAAEGTDQLHRAGLVIVEPGHIRFCAPLLRLAAYTLAGPAWRLTAHARAAEWTASGDSAPVPPDAGPADPFAVHSTATEPDGWPAVGQNTANRSGLAATDTRATPLTNDPIVNLARRRQSVTSDGPLTSREKQIAHLVATGLTNREIATQLFLSQRTIDSHLAHIFAKLEVRSRVHLTTRLHGLPLSA